MTTNRSGNMGTPNGAGTIGGGDGKMSHLQDRVREVVDQGRERVDHLKHRVMDVKDQAVNRGGDLVQRGSEFIRANPIKAVGIAFGVGYLAMRLIRR